MRTDGGSRTQTRARVSRAGRSRVMPTLVLATRSRGKLRELRALAADVGLDVRSLDEAGLPPDPAEAGIETGVTFAENARLKAAWYAARLPAGTLVLAEDSGLVVDALGGLPGVWSRRWSAWPASERDAVIGALRRGEVAVARQRIAALADDEAADGDDREETARNNAALLATLAALGAVTDEARGAAYVCHAVLLGVDGSRTEHTGRVAGRILSAPEGDGGFGYDPLFRSDELSAAFATVDAATKARVSHRARAVRPLLAQVAARAR